MTRIIITGEIGVGKTTLIKNILSNLNIDYLGFKTQKIIQKNEIVGFYLEEISGDSQVFAHIDFLDSDKFNKYGVNLNIFENFGVEILERCEKNNSLLVVDELGKMEQKSIDFSKRMKAIIDSRDKFLIVIQKRAIDFWLSENDINNNNIILFEVTKENREELSKEIQKELNILK